MKEYKSTMNREMRRASKANGKRLMKKDWTEFKDVTKEAIDKHILLGGTVHSLRLMAQRIFSNSKYVVQAYEGVIRDGVSYTKVMVRRNDSAPIYSWQDLFRIKNEIYGQEIEAIQFMPKVSELVDVANLYWFWIKTKDLEVTDDGD